jgi:Bcr/CflA subfamily drug resistance transporter
MQHINEIENPNKSLFAFITLFIIPISGLTIDIYVPSLPFVTHYFHVDKSLAQLTITFYMLGLGLTQLISGGISDSFGRKKPFLIAMGIFILATFSITFVHSIYQLLFLRFLQGVMVGIIVVPLRSIIPDIFKEKEMYKMMNYMTVAWSLGPIVAPAIGGYLQHYFNWKANFYFLGLYSLLGFVLMLVFMPETSQHRHDFQLKMIFIRSLEIFSHPKFLSGIMIDGLLYSTIILFAVIGPFLIQNVLHYSVIDFGHIALLIGFMWFSGTITNRFLINVDLQIKTQIGLWILFFTALVMIVLSIAFPVNIYCIVIPVFLMMWVGGTLFPNYFARGVALFPKFTGSANALFGAFIFLVSGCSSAIATLLKSSSQLPLAIAYLVIFILCLSIHYLMEKCHTKD